MNENKKSSGSESSVENNIALVVWDLATDAISVGKLPWEQRPLPDSAGESETSLPEGVLVPASFPPPPSPDVQPAPAPKDSSGPNPVGVTGGTVSGVPQGFDPFPPRGSGGGQSAGVTVSPVLGNGDGNQSGVPQGSDTTQPMPAPSGNGASDPSSGVAIPPPQSGKTKITIGILNVIEGAPDTLRSQGTYPVNDPNPGEQPEPQDSYGCCTGSQDSYN